MSGDVVARLMAWLQRHPLKRSPQAMQAAYTEEVMARIRACDSAPIIRWLPRPRLALAFGTVAACGLAVAVLIHRTPTQVASRSQHSGQVLAEADKSTDDDAWIQETSELLNAVDDSSTQSSNGESLEELLRELESLDESEIANS